jgi:hypothetical protein
MAARTSPLNPLRPRSAATSPRLLRPLATAAWQKNLTNAFDVNAGFINNMISPSLLSPVMLNVAKTLVPSADPCGRTIYPLVADQDENLYSAKIDWQISDKSSFFGRFMLGDLATGSTYDGKNPLSINSYGYHDYDYGFAFGYTYLFSANLVSSTHLGANRTNVVKIPDNYSSWAGFGAPVTPMGGNMIEIVATNFNIGGGAASVGGQHNGPMPHLAEDLTWIKGDHQILFGGGIYQQRLNYFSGPDANGNATFSGQSTGLVLADVLYGVTGTNGWVDGTQYGFYTRQFYDSLYVSDNWKITPRLTLNYGVRWEPYLSPYNSRGENETFIPADFAAGIHSVVFNNAPAGLFFPGDSQYTSGGYSHNYYNGPVWDKFYPRLGLAWDPEGKGRMTIRAAYGMYGDRAQMLAGTGGYFNAPFGNADTLSGVNMTNPFAGVGGNPFPQILQTVGVGVYSANAPFLLAGSQTTSPLSNFHPVYMNQWNLSIQRQMGRDWLITANYVGNNTIHMISGEGVNQSIYMGLGPCTLPNNAAGLLVTTTYTTCSTAANANARRVLSQINPQQGQYFGAINELDDGGTGEYEGLYLSARKSLSHNLSLLANYTWSHCISDVYNFNPGVVAPTNARRQYRSNCIGIDLRQEFVLNLVATSPRFANRWARIIASNWQVAPILELKSATEFSVFSGVDGALTTAPNQTPNQVSANPYPANQSLSNWINSSAFAQVTPGTYGNLGYNNLKGPGIFQLNVAFSRTFPIREKMSFQLRAEAFNLTNHVNGFAPGVAPINAGAGANDTLTSSSFQSVTSDISGNNGLLPGDYRVVQVAAKFVF